MYDSPVIHSD